MVKENIVDWIVGWMIPEKLSGWNTKVGGASVIVLGVSAILLVVAKSMILIGEGSYYEAIANLDSPELWGGLGALGITKQVLGAALKTDKNTAAMIAIEEGKPGLAKAIAVGAAPPTLVIPAGPTAVRS